VRTPGRARTAGTRYAACQIAGIEPTFITYDGDDADGYALSVNIARRHLSKGQQAMVAAREALVSKGSKATAAKAVGVTSTTGQQAMVVARAVSETDTGLAR
jgi:hypothetical protein